MSFPDGCWWPGACIWRWHEVPRGCAPARSLCSAGATWARRHTYAGFASQERDEGSGDQSGVARRAAHRDPEGHGFFIRICFRVVRGSCCWSKRGISRRATYAICWSAICPQSKQRSRVREVVESSLSFSFTQNGFSGEGPSCFCSPPGSIRQIDAPVITTGRLREYLTRTPFHPLRVDLSDGPHHDIPHPEFAWLVGSRFYVAKIVTGRGPDDSQVDELAVLDVTRIDPLARGGAKK